MKETIKAKAKEIIESYKQEKVFEEKNGTKYTLIITYEQAKKFALIHVNGIIDVLDNQNVINIPKEYDFVFWVKVKQEINKQRYSYGEIKK